MGSNEQSKERAALPVSVTTFGYGHGAPPADAHLTIDLRQHFRDPHVSPEMRYMTAHDEKVRAAVLGTPGILGVIASAAMMARAYLAGPSAGPVHIAVGCAGGRHRAATVGMAVAEELTRDHVVTLTHRDLSKDVIAR